jgi:hypothetical protein
VKPGVSGGADGVDRRDASQGNWQAASGSIQVAKTLNLLQLTGIKYGAHACTRARRRG